MSDKVNSLSGGELAVLAILIIVMGAIVIAYIWFLATVFKKIIELMKEWF